MFISLNLKYLLIFNFFLFLIGFLGLVLNKKNFLILLISIEIILLSINLNFVFFSLYLDDILGQIFVLFILTVAATESALGLAIITNYYQLTNQVFIDYVKTAKN